MTDTPSSSSEANTHSNEHVCERCGHSTSTKSNLLQHLRKKKPCPTTNSSRVRTTIIEELLTPPSNSTNNKRFKCEFCSNHFSSSSSKCQHKKICSKHPSKLLTSVIESMQNEITELRKHITQQPTTSHQTVNNTTNNIENQLNNNINFVINNFGQEDTSYLTSEFLTSCITNPSSRFPDLIEHIHYNPEHPQNHNLRFKSSKKNTFEKFEAQDWHECDATNTLDVLIRKGYRILNAHHSQHILNNDDIQNDDLQRQVYEKFRFLGDKQSVEYCAIKRDLRILVKDRTAFVLVAPGTEINQQEIDNMVDELEHAVSD